MRRTTPRFASNAGRDRSRRRTAVAAWTLVCAVAGAGAVPLQSPVQTRGDRQALERFEELASRVEDDEARRALKTAARALKAQL